MESIEQAQREPRKATHTTTSRHPAPAKSKVEQSGNAIAKHSRESPNDRRG